MWQVSFILLHNLTNTLKGRKHLLAPVVGGCCCGLGAFGGAPGPDCGGGPLYGPLLGGPFGG